MYEEETHPRNKEYTCLLEDEAPEEHDMEEPQELPTMEMSWKRKPAWTREIIREAERCGGLEGSTRERKKPKNFSNYVALMCDIVDQQPINNEEIVHKK